MHGLSSWNELHGLEALDARSRLSLIVPPGFHDAHQPTKFERMLKSKRYAGIWRILGTVSFDEIVGVGTD